MRVVGDLPHRELLGSKDQMERRELNPAGTLCGDQRSVRTMLSEISDLLRIQELVDRVF